MKHSSLTQRYRRALKTIAKWDFAADGRKFNGNHKAVVKEITGIAKRALKFRTLTKEKK